MKRAAAVVFLLASLLVLPGASDAQSYNFTASLLGGIGGSFDADPDPGFTNTTLQLGFSWVSEVRTHVGFRLGRVDFGAEPLGTVVDSELTYLLALGEYRFSESYYESGVFLGLGFYSLDGTPLVAAASGDDTSLGLAVGFTGDFEVSPKFSIVVELAGHFTDLDGAAMFGTALTGLAFHF